MGDAGIDHGDPRCKLYALSDAGQRNLSRYRWVAWRIYQILFIHKKLDVLSASTYIETQDVPLCAAHESKSCGR